MYALIRSAGNSSTSNGKSECFNFLVALDRSGTDYGLAYMDLVTGEFQVTTLNDFSMVCGEIRNLRAREVVLGYELSEQEERVFISQMNLLLSHVETALDDVQLLGDQLSELEKKTAGKLLQYVHQTQMRAGIESPQKSPSL